MDDTSISFLAPNLPLNPSLSYKLSSLSPIPVLRPKATNPNAFLQTRQISSTVWEVQVDAEDGIASRTHRIEIEQYTARETRYNLQIDGMSTDALTFRRSFYQKDVNIKIESWDSDAKCTLEISNGIEVLEQKKHIVEAQVPLCEGTRTVTLNIQSADGSEETETFIHIIKGWFHLVEKAYLS
jgi:hypothetical protein